MPPEAMLLLGPTGSGKTPLGEAIAARGLWGRRCVHFDFGRALRAAAGLPAPDNGLSVEQTQIVADSLRTGALLEDKHFPIAARLLTALLDRRDLDTDDVVVMNGLPRHVGQADDVGRIVDIRWVVHLSCTPEVVLRRIRRDTGGDRISRIDDDPAAVRRKLDIFAARTAPLLEHYRRGGRRIESLEVSATTTAEDAYNAMNDLV